MFTTANVITALRIMLSAALLFCTALSVPFYVLYLAAGITDLIDGAVARATDTVSGFGAKLDTVADLVLVIVCLVKLLPVMSVPAWIWVWTGIIALIKVINIICGFVIRKQFTAIHTVMNRVTGLLLFLLPLTVRVIDLKYSGAVVCTVAAFSAIQEGHFIRTGRKTV